MTDREPHAPAVPVSTYALVRRLTVSTAKICAERYPDAFRGGVPVRGGSDRRLVLPDLRTLELMTYHHVLVGTGSEQWILTLSDADAIAAATVQLACGEGGWHATRIVCLSPTNPVEAELHAIAHALADRIGVPFEDRIWR